MGFHVVSKSANSYKLDFKMFVFKNMKMVGWEKINLYSTDVNVKNVLEFGFSL